MNSRRFACRWLMRRADCGDLGAGRAHFCARLSAFKVLSLFFCNSIEPSPGIDRGGHFEIGWISG